MGREVKRVAMGWDWPIGKVWAGYLQWFRPPKCTPCDGYGFNPEAYRFWKANRCSYEATAAKFPGKASKCKWCHGHGSILPTDPAVLAALEPWKEKGYNDYDFPKTEPPEGDGWQVWSTTSEGTPMTPVCATPEELATWCVTHSVSTFGYSTADYATWLAFITGPGWAPSMAVSSQGVQSGIEFMADLKKEEEEKSR